MGSTFNNNQRYVVSGICQSLTEFPGRIEWDIIPVDVFLVTVYKTDLQFGVAADVGIRVDGLP